MDDVPISEFTRMEATTAEDGILRLPYHPGYIEDVNGCTALRRAVAAQIHVAPADTAAGPTPLRRCPGPSTPHHTSIRPLPAFVGPFLRAQHVVVDVILQIVYAEAPGDKVRQDADPGVD